MVKINQIVLALLAVGSASAFVPAPAQSTRAFGVRFLSEESVDAVVEEPKATPAAPKVEASTGGKLVAIKEETVEFTAGLLGGVIGLAVGGPVLGAIGAAASNFAAKSDSEISDVISAVSKSSIEVYNYLIKLDSKYSVLNKAKDSLESALVKVKSSDSVNPETVAKVEDALAKTTAKISEINEEYDIVGAGMTALGVIGELVEKAVVKASELNSEYQLTDKALTTVKSSVEKAKDAAKSS